MNYLFATVALLGSLSAAQAQTSTPARVPVLRLHGDWVNPLPMDSATGKISFKAVVQMPGATQAAL
ncbi:hypothetical protein [Hymenobacter baengnokdamensis]|uniref:hypothetical protein n=1 Tax=Hymenobacter baengnokdamensis TaxID=2615203 RepID=UPI00124862D7|nr:hypothetical protein [Hymenobacter baengnokdamensis]